MVIGSIIPFSGTRVPNGFLVCNGSIVSRATYADLYNVIGTTYGAGDGSSTFGLPNLSGRALVGVSSSYALASTGGVEKQSLTTDTIPSHGHTVPVHGHANTLTATTPVFTHTVGQPSFTYTALNSGTSNQGGSYTTTANRYTSRASAAMSRKTNLAITAHAATNCTMSGSVTNKAAFDTNSAGTGSSPTHNNMMPYMALTYIIYAFEDEPVPGDKMYLFNGALPVSANGSYICGKA